MSHTDVWLEDWFESDGQLTVGAVLEQPGRTRQRLWYRMPAEIRPAITHSADPFVAGTLFTAMQMGGRLTVHGQVSPSLLRNLTEFQAAWARWRPEVYHPVEIRADHEQELPLADASEAVMTFSGGLDACFTAWRHHRSLANRQQQDLRAGVIIHGFDILLARQTAYHSAAERARQLLASIGMDCIPLTTNFRELDGYWQDTHGAALASVLMLLSRRYRVGLIASSFHYACLVFPYGSNPLTDGMFSSDAFRIVHDGGGFTRVEKTRQILPWPEMAKYLRVCWQGKQPDRNCCRCQKCVSNMLYFRILGRPKMECFPQDISNLEIVLMRYHEIEKIKSMQRILAVARSEGVKESWVRALKVSVFLNQIRLLIRGPRKALVRRIEVACIWLARAVGARNVTARLPSHQRL